MTIFTDYFYKIPIIHKGDVIIQALFDIFKPLPWKDLLKFTENSKPQFSVLMICRNFDVCLKCQNIMQWRRTLSFKVVFLFILILFLAFSSAFLIT